MEDTQVPEQTLTHEQLKAEGFIYKYDLLMEIGEDPEDYDDPFYYYKGEFRIYDVVESFYFNGARIYTLEQVKEQYEVFTNRTYVPTVVLEDTAAPNYAVTGKANKSMFVKAKLRGGPGDGLTVKWPKGLVFFVYQCHNDKGKQEGYRYRRKEGAKTIFLYAGPLQ